jgi:hypothetical protein
VEDTERADDELLESRSWPRWMRALVVLGVVLVLGVVVRQAVTRSGEPSAHPADSPAAPAPEPAGTHTALPDGPAPTGLPRRCPHAVVCSRLETEPPALVSAVLDNLPLATVRRVHSIVYVSPAENRDVVWYRTLLLRSGAARIAVEVRQPARGDSDHEESYRIGVEQGVRLEKVFFDRTVSIRLTGVAPSLTLDQLRGLARDVRLVAA